MTKPPIAAEVDLRDFTFMPLDVVRLRDSDLTALASGDEFRAAVLLWCASWHQVPAGSLPDDDRMLTHLAGLGRDVDVFGTLRDMALHGFEKHRDGRLYHPVIVEKANESWERKQEGAADREADRQRKKEWRARNREQNQEPSPVGQGKDGTPDETGTEPGHDPDVRSMTGTGTGTGTEEKKGTSDEVPKESSPSPDGDPPAAEFDPVADRPAALDRGEVGKAVALWNAMAADSGLFPQVQKITTARRAKLRARLKDCGGLEGWGAALTKIRRSPFLTGQNDRGWRADFDFMLQDKSFTKLMEGGYDPRPDDPSGPGGGSLSPTQAAVSGILGGQA